MITRYWEDFKVGEVEQIGGKRVDKEEMIAFAHDAGFVDARTVSTADLAERYLSGRSDGLSAAGGEGMLVART